MKRGHTSSKSLSGGQGERFEVLRLVLLGEKRGVGEVKEHPGGQKGGGLSCGGATVKATAKRFEVG
jgi:hypothetical protein